MGKEMSKEIASVQDCPHEQELFRRPDDDARYLVLETGQTMSYAELCSGVDPALLPADENQYQQLLDSFGVIELG